MKGRNEQGAVGSSDIRMKSKQGKVLKTVGALLAITLVMGIILSFPYSRLLLFRVAISIKAHQVEQDQIRLLCKTNPQALLEACRELSKQVAAGELAPRTYHVRSRKRLPEVSGFPKLILDLSPRSISIDEDERVMLQMGGGFANFGVSAYPEDYKEPYRNFVYGNRKIIDGLWYRDAEYEGSPEYQRKIEALIQKGKQAYRN